MTRRKWYMHDFLAESLKLLETAPTSNEAGLTPLAEGLSNISKYLGHLLDIICYDGNPLNQGLFEVDGACVNKTLHMALDEKVQAGEVRRACWFIYQTSPSYPSPWICCNQCTSHICAEICRYSFMLEPHTSLYVGSNTLQYNFTS
ncbi:uncharacterized protein TNCV_43081 [Trichonephila clavipes]|nr:uncharacterized protein TNCV_43081 [Trichonephila clavipes]